MLKDPVQDRLRWVNDQCPLPGSGIPSLPHTLWYAASQRQSAVRVREADGYTATVFQTRLFSWYRSFTYSVPPAPKSGSFITLHEWIPAHEPKAQKGWLVFGPPYTTAYARLHADYRKDWRQHARRHLRDFEKSGCTLRLGTRTDVIELYKTSQVPKSLQIAMLKKLDLHAQSQPETVDILVAEKAGQPIACLVAGNCDEIKMSEYIIGAFHPDFKKAQGMVGLVDWWYQRSLARGYPLVTFGHMEPAAAKRIPASINGNGYTLFKTHFSVMRMWFPRNRWRLLFSHRAAFSK